jgi:hypothetical protein
MELGYVKIYRSFLDKGYFKHSEYVHLWVYLLMRASYCEKEYLFNGSLHRINPGQFITGRNQISKDTGIHRSKIERILKCFETEHQIEQVTTPKFRIITICNWGEYQQSEQVNEQQVSNKRATSEQQVSTIKKDKKDKKERNKSMSDLDFYNGLKEIFTWVDFDSEMKKIDFWIANHPGRRKTRRFVINWFNKIEKPLEGEIKKAWNA